MENPRAKDNSVGASLEPLLKESEDVKRRKTDLNNKSESILDNADKGMEIPLLDEKRIEEQKQMTARKINEALKISLFMQQEEIIRDILNKILKKEYLVDPKFKCVFQGNTLLHLVGSCFKEEFNFDNIWYQFLKLGCPADEKNKDGLTPIEMLKKIKSDNLYKALLGTFKFEVENNEKFYPGAYEVEDLSLTYSSKCKNPNHPERKCDIPDKWEMLDSKDGSNLSLHERLAMLEVFNFASITKIPKNIEGLTLSSPKTHANFITANLGFIVSTSAINSAKKHQLDFITIPIDHPEWLVFRSTQEPAKKEEKNHSEGILFDYLKEKNNLFRIVTNLSEQLKIKYGSYEGHKVYGLVFDIHSSRDMCNHCLDLFFSLQKDRLYGFKLSGKIPEDISLELYTLYPYLEQNKVKCKVRNSQGIKILDIHEKLESSIQEILIDTLKDFKNNFKYENLDKIIKGISEVISKEGYIINNDANSFLIGLEEVLETFKYVLPKEKPVISKVIAGERQRLCVVTRITSRMAHNSVWGWCSELSFNVDNEKYFSGQKNIPKKAISYKNFFGEQSKKIKKGNIKNFSNSVIIHTPGEGYGRTSGNAKIKESFFSPTYSKYNFFDKKRYTNLISKEKWFATPQQTIFANTNKATIFENKTDNKSKCVPKQQSYEKLFLEPAVNFDSGLKLK